MSMFHPDTPKMPNPHEAHLEREVARLRGALQRIHDEEDAPLFKRWDDYYVWVQSIASAALETQ